jgi:hypothetical protein
VTAGVIFLLAPKGNDSGDQHSDAEAWESKAQAAFADLVGRVPSLVSGARMWLAGEKSTDDFRAEVDRSLTAFGRSRDRITNLKAPKDFAIAKDLYVRSAHLYVETARTYAVAVDVAAPDLRGQLDLLARRLRELGDRVFDRGRTALGIAPPATPDVDVNVPEEVPIWTAEGLAAGPPLDVQPPPPATSPPLRQETRPQQSRRAWVKDVRAAGIPSTRQLRDAINVRDPARLAELARQFVAAAEKLRARPDPKGGREESARLRLGLLIGADSARAAQASADLVDTARRLAAISAAMISV